MPNDNRRKEKKWKRVHLTQVTTGSAEKAFNTNEIVNVRKVWLQKKRDSFFFYIANGLRLFFDALVFCYLTKLWNGYLFVWQNILLKILFYLLSQVKTKCVYIQYLHYDDVLTVEFCVHSSGRYNNIFPVKWQWLFCQI